MRLHRGTVRGPSLLSQSRYAYSASDPASGGTQFAPPPPPPAVSNGAEVPTVEMQEFVPMAYAAAFADALPELHANQQDGSAAMRLPSSEGGFFAAVSQIDARNRTQEGGGNDDINDPANGELEDVPALDLLSWAFEDRGSVCLALGGGGSKM